ncbi:accessory protein [Ninove microtus virus]|uniref:Accessory protein n=1 Tax=Ninove microtus virus TaxID=2940990 RepID=A0AAE9KYX7_9MONO|nr:accessory protein [Ninove microtus virus]
MESRLSSLYNRLRRTLRKRTAEVPYKNQRQGIESKLGKELQESMTIREESQTMKREVERESRKRRAKEIIKWLDDLEEERGGPRSRSKAAPKLVIGKMGMVRILLLAIQLSGDLPILDFQELERREILDPVEIQNMREALVMIQSAMKTFESC